MKKYLLVVTAIFIALSNLSAQKQCPGITVVGSGYDVFGEYADNKSVKEPLFIFNDQQTLPMDDGQEYKIPSLIRLKFINEKDYKVTEGSSLRQYASSLSAEAGVAYDGFLFSGSVSSRFGKEKSQSTSNYFYTITDWTRVWKVYINPAKTDLRQFLTADAKTAIDTWSAEKLFEVFGTHFVNSGYLGGSMEFSLSEKFTSQSEANSIAVSVQAKYANVSGDVSISVDTKQVNESMKSNTKIKARGGDVQYANKSSAGDNSQYNLWVNSIPTKAVLIDFEENSLVPIWTLATGTRKTELETAFKKMLLSHPLPKEMANLASLQMESYMIKCKANGLYWDFEGYNTDAKVKDAKLLLGGLDKEGQGFDRVYKVLSLNKNQLDAVYFQPQHTEKVVVITGGSKEANADFTLATYNEGFKSQNYILELVEGESNMFYIKVKYNGLYLTGKSGKVIQTAMTKSDNQKWVFELFNPKNIALPKSAYYAVKSKAADKYWDFAGTYPNVSGTKLISTKMGKMEGDRVYKFARIGSTKYYVIRPGHSSSKVLTARKSGEQIFLFDQKRSDNQLFTFEYGNKPLSYFIIHKGTGSAIHLRSDRTQMDGTEIKLFKKSKNADYQKWQLIFYKK